MRDELPQASPQSRHSVHVPSRLRICLSTALLQCVLILPRSPWSALSTLLTPSPCSLQRISSTLGLARWQECRDPQVLRSYSSVPSVELPRLETIRPITLKPPQ